MIAVLVWVCAATALWHFTILLPDRFYGGLMGALIAANLGAFAVGGVGLGWPPAAAGNGLADVYAGGAGAVGALAASYLLGSRFDPVTGTTPWRRRPRRLLRAAIAIATLGIALLGLDVAP